MVYAIPKSDILFGAIMKRTTKRLLEQAYRRVRRIRRLAAASLAAAFALAAAGVQAEPLTSLSLTLDGGAVLTFEEGAVSVPEARDRQASRQISIGFRRIAAEPGAAGAPVFLLAGGPGGSYSERLDEGGDRQAASMTVIDMYRRVGDVVLVDLRGVNLSTPQTLCNGAPNKWRRLGSEDDYYDLIETTGRACREKLLSEGFDLAGYTVTAAAADIIAVADALGYDKINLAGTSFGSHWGLTIAKYYPERVARMVLTGIEGFDHTIDDPAGVLAAVEKISEAARSVWNEAHDAEGPVEALRLLAARVERGERKGFGLRRYEIADAMVWGRNYALSSRDGMYEWPRAVADMLDGKVRYHKAVRWFMARNIGRGWDAAAVGMFDCASWITPRRLAELRAQAELLVTNNVDYYEALCAGWAIDPLPDGFREDFRSEVPALFIHGDADVSTPLGNALETIKQFPNGHLTIVEGGSHAVLTETLQAHPILEEQIIDWLSGGAPPPAQLTLPPIEFRNLR